MNKLGQTMGLAILSFLAVIICGFVFINFIMPEISDFRVNLNCANADSISDGTKVLCLIGDTVVPYVIIGIVAVAVGIIMARVNL